MYNYKKKNLFVTTALPYINGDLHLGHIMEFIQADIWVRFHKMNYKNVFFICGDDTHGTATTLFIKKKKISLEKYLKLIKKERKYIIKKFFISFDNWINTNYKINHKTCKKIFLKLKKKNLIYNKNIFQFFDTNEKIFLPDRYIKGICPKCNSKDQNGDYCEKCGNIYTPNDLIKPYSILSNTTPILKESKQIFLKLSLRKCKKILIKWIFKNNKFNIEIKNKIKEWIILNNLKDWNISRDEPYFGIKIPNTNKKYFYVWFDACIGYLSILKHFLKKKNINFKSFILNKNTKQYHFIGKDIIYFHLIILPIIYKFSGYKIPNNIFIHGFVNINKKKLSKSKKNNFSIIKYIQTGMNTEWIRYYLASKLNYNIKDIEFNIIEFKLKINSDLIGKYINIISRISFFLNKYFNNIIISDWNDNEKKFLNNIKFISKKIKYFYKKLNYKEVINIIIKKLNEINLYIEKKKPWNLLKNSLKLHKFCSMILEAFRIITIYITPILPETSRRVELIFRIKIDCFDNINNSFKNRHKINPYIRLMDRIREIEINYLNFNI